MKRITNLLHDSAASIQYLALLGSLFTAAPVFAQDKIRAEHMAQPVPAQLLQDVRAATKQFRDVNNAVKAGYGPAFGCVTGPDHGAMGIHYVTGALARWQDRAQASRSSDLRTHRKHTPTGGRRIHRRRGHLAGGSQQCSAGCLRTRTSSSSPRRTVLTWPTSSNGTFGRGGTIPRERLSIGTIR